MTTASFNTRVRHDSNAVYEEWLQEFSDQLDAIGLTQTADTGQVTIAGITRPAIGTYNGYQIRIFNDSLQATAPIFIRFDFGTGSGSSNGPQVGVSVGTGSDGAGNLTATGLDGFTLTTLARMNPGNFGGFTNNDTLRQSLWCHTEGFLGLSWKNNATAGIGLPGLFAICRTCDDDGVPDGRGMLVDWSVVPQSQAARFSPNPFAWPVNTANPRYLGFQPMAPANTLFDGDPQAAIAWTLCEKPEALFGLCGIYPAEHAAESTFSVAMVGSTARTFISTRNWLFGNPTTMRVGMLWE